jgi:hypothetical protein
VFLVNSRQAHFTAAHFGSGGELLHLMWAPLLPKLRGQFAEFLNEPSHMRLRIFSLPTCVGLRYGHITDSLTRLFQAAWAQSLPALKARRHPLSALRCDGFAYHNRLQG